MSLFQKPAQAAAAVTGTRHRTAAHHRWLLVVGLLLGLISLSQAQVSVDGFADIDFCLDSLRSADSNNDQELDREEYVEFARLQAPPGLLDEVESYEELQVPYKLAFTSLACLCRDPAFGGDPTDTGCCIGDRASIFVPDNLDERETLLFLATVCVRTDAATQIVLEGSLAPSAAPTRGPTEAPTEAPTFAVTTEPPTVAPTFAVTTEPPTVAPTVAVTTEPPVITTEPPSTMAPSTEAPSTEAPVGGPTLPPATMPPSTAAPTDETPLMTTAIVDYKIVVENGMNTDIDESMMYLSDLQVAMNILSVQVRDEYFTAPSDTRRRHERRHLAVGVGLPTQVEVLNNFDCSEDYSDVTDDSDVCQDIRSEITLTLTGMDRNEDTKTEYESQVWQEIYDGELQRILDDMGLAPAIQVLTGREDKDGGDASKGESTSLSSGATAGIVIAALVVALVPIAFFLRKRQMRPTSTAKDAEFDKYDDGDDNGGDGSVQPESVDTDLYTDAAVKGTALAGVATLGASQADYGKGQRQSSRKALEAMEAGNDVLAEPELDNERDSSSAAGSSGWSSSAGISSLNTGSVDDSMDAAAAAGIGLAAIGATSALSRKLDKEKKSTEAGDVPEVPEVNRSQLDNLIEAGDWAAVGATAALLAAASDSQSASSRSRTSRSQRSASSSVDAARAAELDHLVDAGDWEGVVLAAAKFEAAERSVKSGTNSSIDSASASAETSGTGTGTGTRSVTTSVSDSPSKTAKRAETREEVEALVRRVVPEEIDNVDEMMNQFKGREEELVETLRTMQERQVAQKARAAGHKAAKVDARRSVQRGVVPGVEGGSGAAAGTASGGLSAGAAAGIGVGAAVAGAAVGAAAAGALKDSSKGDESGSSSGMDTSGSAQQTRTALEMAIEAGDWDAVGEAAAMMSDASVTTASSGEIGRLADANLSQTTSGSASTPRSRRSLQGINAERAAELDEMINVGDWSGVVAAAAQFSQADKSKSKSGPTEKRSKEEEDALAQAEMWSKIAEQKKAEGATDTGASDAAEWAISRSLSQLKEAERSKEAEDKEDKEEDEV